MLTQRKRVAEFAVAQGVPPAILIDNDKHYAVGTAGTWGCVTLFLHFCKLGAQHFSTRLRVEKVSQFVSFVCVLVCVCFSLCVCVCCCCCCCCCSFLTKPCSNPRLNRRQRRPWPRLWLRQQLYQQPPPPLLLFLFASFIFGSSRINKETRRRKATTGPAIVAGSASGTVTSATADDKFDGVLPSADTPLAPKRKLDRVKKQAYIVC